MTGWLYGATRFRVYGRFVAARVRCKHCWAASSPMVAEGAARLTQLNHERDRPAGPGAVTETVANE